MIDITTEGGRPIIVSWMPTATGLSILVTDEADPSFSVRFNLTRGDLLSAVQLSRSAELGHQFGVDQVAATPKPS
jgi:hypothetical protein